MANIEIRNPPIFQESVKKFETTDYGSAEVFNVPLETLVNNDVYLKEKLSQVAGDIGCYKPDVQSSDQESQLDFILDHYSDSLPNNSTYRFLLNCNVVHSVLWGGMKVIDGFKANDDYQYQIADTYFWDKPKRRNKREGKWGEWLDT